LAQTSWLKPLGSNLLAQTSWLKTQDNEDAGIALTWTQFTRTHLSMSFCLGRFLKTFETEGKGKVARDLRSATAKIRANIELSEARLRS
jgi:hypothetical protein